MNGGNEVDFSVFSVSSVGSLQVSSGKDQPRYAVGQFRFVEVDDQPQRDLKQFHIAQRLCFLNRRELRKQRGFSTIEGNKVISVVSVPSCSIKLHFHDYGRYQVARWTSLRRVLFCVNFDFPGWKILSSRPGKLFGDLPRITRTFVRASGRYLACHFPHTSEGSRIFLGPNLATRSRQRSSGKGQVSALRLAFARSGRGADIDRPRLRAFKLSKRRWVMG